MTLFFDVTKASSSRQFSGLIRVSEKLRQALTHSLGDALVPVCWHQRKSCFIINGKKTPVEMTGSDYFLTAEVFSSDERPGYWNHVKKAGIRSAAIFHDAIPWMLPEITWPKSVRRHPQYMKDLAALDHVFAVSPSSAMDLSRYWDEFGIGERPDISHLALGADFFDRATTAWEHKPQHVPLILNVGIIEPRKNQTQLLEVAIRLWEAGHKFELSFVGRVNPHFGKPIEKKIKRAAKRGYPVQLHSKQSDGTLLDLYSRSHFTVFSSIAEGFGLPVAESLWLGIPCITRALPSLESFFDRNCCVSFDSPPQLETAMSVWLSDPALLASATSASRKKSLPTWSESAKQIIHGMRAES
jgi:glycosyltransferase involved in cell wall biosynthesis